MIRLIYIGVMAMAAHCMNVGFCFAEGPTNGERILYRRALSEGRELIVVRGPDRPISDAKDVLPGLCWEGRTDKPSSIYLLSVEVRSPRSESLPLYVSIGCKKTRDQGDRRIADLLMDNRPVLAGTVSIPQVTIYMVSIGDGSDILVDRICPGTTHQWTYLRDVDWNVYAHRPAGASKEIRVTLKEAEGGKVEANVEDLLPNGKRTRFVLGDKEWQSGFANAVKPDNEAKP